MSPAERESQHILLAALRDPAVYDHAVGAIEVLETHISYVLLTGPYAYKIKKPLNLGFLDFSTLERRRHYCAEELRLNRRLASELYLEVVPITGSPEAPVLRGHGPAIEYAVKMVQFPQETLLDRVLARGEVRPEQIEALARQIAAFHRAAAIADPASPYGTPEQVHAPAVQNFIQLEQHLPAGAERALLARLRAWTEQAYQALRPAFAARKEGGFIRECHGDMHTGNMVLRDGRIVVFDCIEFNPNLRWIDLMSEVAFLVMDLEDRARADLARRFLNAYLEAGGDYAGLPLLRYYQVYRALVRAKVTAIRLGQPGLEAAAAAPIRARCHGYLQLAERSTATPAPLLAITCGLSGSGKSTVTQSLLDGWEAIRIRSDVVRKALFGLAPEARSGSAVAEGLYAADASALTYRRLIELARTALTAGYRVILDATFLQQAQRAAARGLAAELGVPFRILHFQAPAQVLRARVTARAQAGRDASEADLAVLEHQIARFEPLTAEERAAALVIDTDRPLDLARLRHALER